MIWLWYDMWMMDICICCHMIWKWHDICHGMRYVINWHVCDMIYCDAICYDTICIWWNVMLKAWNVMLCLLNCVYTAWYECYEITINGMKYNPVRIMYDMRNEKWEMIWYGWKTVTLFSFHIEWKSSPTLKGLKSATLKVERTENSQGSSILYALLLILSRTW